VVLHPLRRLGVDLRTGGGVNGGSGRPDLSENFPKAFKNVSARVLYRRQRRRLDQMLGDQLAQGIQLRDEICGRGALGFGEGA
jgi:hypothetical protein